MRPSVFLLVCRRVALPILSDCSLLVWRRGPRAPCTCLEVREVSCACDKDDSDNDKTTHDGAIDNPTKAKGRRSRGYGLDV